MGLFSRKEAKSSRTTAHRPRPSVSSEAQAASLRVRARRRLAGAVALVLAAVIVLPMLLDGEPRPVPAGIEIAVPERNAPFNPELSAPPVGESAGGEGQAVAVAPVGDVDVPTTDLTAPDSSVPAATPKPPETPAATTKQETTAQPQRQEQAQTATAPAAPAAPVATPKPDQTDLALAILEGRGNAATSPATGSFVLQVASYSTDADAKARVEKLKSEGVSNAFVEPATVNGKTTFRLRVGPFDSRPAAQAAQARLRTLGYENGFITTK